jgi:hypothetical protein
MEKITERHTSTAAANLSAQANVKTSTAELMPE